MKVIGGTRRSGRTTRLIELCAESEASGNPSYIICHSETEAHRIFRLAKEINLNISFPLTYEEFANFHGFPANYKFYIDNVEYLLKRLLNTLYSIDAVAITVDEILLPKVAA